MVKDDNKKVKELDEPVELDESVEIEDDDPEEELEEVEGGIFDEDLDHIEELEFSSDFDIGNTMLSSAPPVESWHGQNLEEAISRERVEKDWGDEEEFVAGDFYKNSDGGDFYGTGSNSGVYSPGSDRGSGTYESGVKYEDVKSAGEYPEAGGSNSKIKSYDRIKDERRSRGSMLEIAGLDAKERDKAMRSDINEKEI